MDHATRSQLLDLNRRFYQVHSASFDRTRRAPWTGWPRLAPIFRQSIPQVRCLDLGCGNGRFAKFLFGQELHVASYRGLDASQELINAARTAMPGAEWRVADLLENAWENEMRSPNLIVLFGVLHHLPGSTTRVEVLSRCAHHLEGGGLLVYSHWLRDRRNDFGRLTLDPRIVGVDPEKLEPGDYLLSWQGDGHTPRYCHFPDDQEIEALVAATHLEEVASYDADGPGARDNRYLVLRKPMLSSTGSTTRRFHSQ